MASCSKHLRLVALLSRRRIRPAFPNPTSNLFSSSSPSLTAHFSTSPKAHEFSAHRKSSREARATSWPGWEPAIGLELHVQLASREKLFSRGSTSVSRDVNSGNALFDAATPGSQPIFSQDCLRLALIAALALKCEIMPSSRFDRKHYFYGDLPSGYQITQHYSAFATKGIVDLDPELDGTKRPFSVRIHQIQLEQDTAKSTRHPITGNALVDLNRAGQGLIEIVTEPDMQSPSEASAFVRKLQAILRHIGVSDGNMESGSLRCDVNVSVRREGDSTPGTRCEVKNVNGFGNIESAICSELTRHIELLSDGQTVSKETRGYDVAKSSTFKLRSKEETTDYRYMPDPDIPPLVLPPAFVTELQSLVPPTPSDLITRLCGEPYNLSPRNAKILISIGEGEHDLRDSGVGVRYFEAVFDALESPKEGKVVADWMTNHLLAGLAKSGTSLLRCPISPYDFAKFLTHLRKGLITREEAKLALAAALQSPHPSLSELLSTTTFPTAQSAHPTPSELAKTLISEMPAEAQSVKSGKIKVVERMIGQGMRKAKGRVDANELRKEILLALEVK